MYETEKTLRSRGEHLKKNEVKTEIIGYILSKDDVVPGPDIVQHLWKKSNIVDEKNIRIHLKDLQKQQCIERIPHKPGLENKWKIEKIESLRSILKHYPDIQLNIYDKSINIVLEELTCKGYLPTDTDRKQFFIQLCLSVSFFNKCLKEDFKKICDIAYKIYQYGEGFKECEYIQNYIEILYTNYIKHISVSPKIWLDVYNENINNTSEVDIHLNSIINLPNVEISKNTFQEIFENTELWRVDLSAWEPKFVEEYAIKMADMINQKTLNKISTKSKKWNYELKDLTIYILEKMLTNIPDKIPGSNNCFFFEELPVKISYEIFQRMFKEIPTEFLDIPDDICKILTEVLVKIFQIVAQEMQDSPEKVRETSEKIQAPYEHIQEYPEEVREYLERSREEQEEIRLYEEEMGEYPEEEIEEIIKGMDLIVCELVAHQHTIRFSVNQVMFEHYFHIDIEEGIDSDDERKYVIIMKRLQAKLKKEMILSQRDTFALDQFYENYMKKRKEKSGNA